MYFSVCLGLPGTLPRRGALLDTLIGSNLRHAHSVPVKCDMHCTYPVDSCGFVEGGVVFEDWLILWWEHFRDRRVRRIWTTTNWLDTPTL